MYRIIFLPLVSGFCVALGQPAFFPVLGLLASAIGFSLFWRALDSISENKIFRASFGWFFLVQLVQLSWLVSLEYQGTYILILYVGLSAGMALQFAFLTKKLWKTPCLDGVALLALTGLWTLFEWMRLYVFCGFAFNFVGVLLSGSIFSLQLASLFGVLGMSFWVILTNLLGLKVLRVFSLNNLLKWLIVAAVPYLYGSLHIVYHDSIAVKKNEYAVLLVQPSLTPSKKDLLKGRAGEFIPPLKQWERMVEWISAEKHQLLDLLAFPEAVVPFGLNQYIYRKEEVNSIFLRHFGEEVERCFPIGKEPFSLFGKVSNAYVLQTIANFFNTTVLAGLDYEEGDGFFYNSMFCFQPAGEFPLRYDKRVLLPLAEYMPFSFLSSLSQYYGITDFFSKGSQAVVFPGAVAVGPSICYEELFSSLMRESKKKGADLFVNISNDGWYPFSRLSEQHFTQGLIRSVENGIPLVRACNIGITGAVDCFGRVVALLQDREEGCLFVKVPSAQYKTGFSFWGEAPLVAFSCLFVLIGCFKFFPRNSFF